MTGPSDDDEWWTTTDVAAYLGVAVRTVAAYRSRQQMPAPDKTIGRLNLWRPAKIIEWHQSRGVTRRRQQQTQLEPN